MVNFHITKKGKDICRNNPNSGDTSIKMLAYIWEMGTCEGSELDVKFSGGDYLARKMVTQGYLKGEEV